ncbi:N-acetylglucosamine-1-phosphodiester alpha-N-acetylglucosaminidase [Magallana gigas]|uniref:N-acetylglucosamine-1-phosphodiester alpha-N-acetylglucosaminidase n=1 Tax=Magallana gigas TaxID=29159 RepID=UPI00333E456E
MLQLFGVPYILSTWIQSTTVLPDFNLCRQLDGSMYCCTGYYLTEYGCQECIGSFGLNCSLPCLSGYFGPRCTLHCQCVKDKCDAKFGCPKDKDKTSLEISTGIKTTMKNFKITASSQLVSLNSTSENFFQKLSLKYWVLICSTAFAVVSVAIGCFIFVKIKAERKRRRSQNDFKSEMELKEFFDNATKIPSSGYVYRKLP